MKKFTKYNNNYNNNNNNNNNSHINSYVSKYQQPIAVETKASADALCRLGCLAYTVDAYNVKFNTKMKNRVSLNKHQPAADIRDFFENRNVNEYSDIEIVDGEMINTRLIIDVQSHKLALADFAVVVAAPKITDYDFDKNRRLRAKLCAAGKCRSKHLPNSSYHDLLYDGTLQEFCQDREIEHDLEDFREVDYLYNLTDVIYSLTNEDLYFLTKNNNYGTCMVGTMHVPKYTDNQTHALFVEGMFVGSYRSNKTKMTYKMNGNDHYYTTPLRFPELSNRNEFIIPSPKDCDYHLIICVLDRYDMGSSDYIRFSVQKLKKKSLDLRREAYIMGAPDDYFNDPKIGEGYKQIAKLNGFQPEEEADVKPVVDDVQDGNMVTFYKKTPGRLINYYNYIRCPKISAAKVIASIEKNVADKVQVAFLNAAKIDGSFIKSQISYIVRNSKSASNLDIINDIIPILAHVCERSLTLEMLVAQMVNTKSVKATNDVKKGEYSLKPQSLYDAYKKGELCNYIAFYFKCLFNEECSGKIDQGF